MIFWHMGVAAVIVYVTLGRSRIDYRWILIGAVAPDVIDGILSLTVYTGDSGRGVAHSVLAVVAVAVTILMGTRGTTRISLFGLAVGFAKSVSLFLNGDELDMRDKHGRPITDDSFMLLFNASEFELPFTIPSGAIGNEWATAIDTNDPLLEEGSRISKAGEEIAVASRSLVVLRRVA